MPETFPLFPILPIEIRLKIWTLTLPPPYLFSQRSPCFRNGWSTLDSTALNTALITERRNSYRIGDFSLPSKRPIPAVLHVCRETREEFLASKDTTSRTLNHHPVYEPVVFFKNGVGGSFANPAFVDLKRDGLYTIIQDLDSPFSLRCPIEHLILKGGIDPFDGSFLFITYPNLKSITIALEVRSHPIGWFNAEGNEVIPEEKDGEIDIEGFLETRRPELEGLKSRVRKMLGDVLLRYEELPRLKWRLLEQFGVEVGEGWKGVGI